MKRSAPNSSDNFFVMLFQTVTSRRIPLVLRIASHILLLVALAMVIYAWVMGMQFKQAMQQQANAVGQSLITQTAMSASESLVANDMLSLNVLLGNLVKNPLVSHAVIYSVDNHILAEAGTRPSHPANAQGMFSSTITFQDTIAGQLQIDLDMRHFEQPMTISMQSMGLLSLLLLVLSLVFSLRLGRQISTPLKELRYWLYEPSGHVPHTDRRDEIGDLAREIQEREGDLGFEEGDFEQDDDGYEDDDDDILIEDIDTEDEDNFADEDEPLAEHTAVLAIELAQEPLRRLPSDRLNAVLNRYRSCLEQAADLYDGELFQLKDGGSLILFHDESSEEYLGHAVCCGELMRAFGHALQIELSDTGISLQLQMGLSHGPALIDLSQAELLLSESVQSALELSQHSRNLLLLEQEVAEDDQVFKRARVRSVMEPENASCVERLVDPYPALLERQLGRLLIAD